MLDSKEAIFKLEDARPPVELFIPEWNDTVLLKWPSANTRDTWEIYCQDHKKTPKTIWRGKIASMFLCDADSKLLFKDAEAFALGNQPAAALQRIWDKATSMMAVSEVEIAELEGKSEASPCDSSS